MSLTDAQLLARLQKAELLLKQTEHGYTSMASRWRQAMALIDEVQEELSEPPKPPVPALGPIILKGRSALLSSPTHNSDGFPGIWPAYDDGFGLAGRAIVAPEAGKVTSHHGSAGGVGFKFRGVSGIVHLILHAASRPAVGSAFIKGAKLSTIARIPESQGGPHVHHALDTRPLIGAWLLYGGQQKPSDAPRDYSYGSPTIGAQLAKAMA